MFIYFNQFALVLGANCHVVALAALWQHMVLRMSDGHFTLTLSFWWVSAMSLSRGDIHIRKPKDGSANGQFDAGICTIG